MNGRMNEITATARAAVVTPRAAERVRAGHPWVQKADLVSAPGGVLDVIPVVDRRGTFLGTALYSPASLLPLRMLSRDECQLDAALLVERIAAALARRQHRGGLVVEDAFRLVHGEADLLPGLFIDCYADVAVIQTTCAPMDAREPLIASLLHERFGFRLVVARDDGGARDFEGLVRRRGILAGSGPTRVAYHDAGSAVEVDVLVDGKTGSFLDQQENHARAAEYARSLAAERGAPIDALDTFSYHGGFSLALARTGARVSACDESAAAIASLRENAVRNHVVIDAACDNAFDLLRRADSEDRRYDLVVIDPPALAKRRNALPAAERAYKELNLRALRILRPGGILITCSCSGKLPSDRFAAVVADAVSDVGRPVQLLERRGAGRDHPPLLGVPETEYLKCWVLRLVA